MCENSEPSLECGPRSPYRIEVRLSKFKISENTFRAFSCQIILYQNTMTWYFHSLEDSVMLLRHQRLTTKEDLTSYSRAVWARYYLQGSFSL